MRSLVTGTYRHHVLPANSRTIAVDDPPSETGDTAEAHVLMEWSLWDERDDELTGRRVRVVPHDDPRGTWKAILEIQPHAECWVERATIGYGESIAEFGVVDS